MATLSIQLPSLLDAVIDGALTFSIEADTLDGAFRALRDQHPRIALHLFDEIGCLRRHVLCFYNATNTRWLDDLSAPLADGDTLLFMQAVTGG